METVSHHFLGRSGYVLIGRDLVRVWGPLGLVGRVVVHVYRSISGRVVGVALAVSVVAIVLPAHWIEPATGIVQLLINYC